jgi:hypothetical protein
VARWLKASLRLLGVEQTNPVEGDGRFVSMRIAIDGSDEDLKGRRKRRPAAVSSLRCGPRCPAAAHAVRRRSGDPQAGAASHHGPQHVELGSSRGRVEAVLDQPAGRHQTPPRPPRADHVEVDVGAISGDEIGKVLLMS